MKKYLLLIILMLIPSFISAAPENVSIKNLRENISIWNASLS
jgi:hypothetical protein